MNSEGNNCQQRWAYSDDNDPKHTNSASKEQDKNPKIGISVEGGSHRVLHKSPAWDGHVRSEAEAQKGKTRNRKV